MDWESLIWNTDIPAMRKLVMLAIARKADASGMANISVAEISAVAMMARQSVYDQITVAIQRNQLQRIAPSVFRISLTQAVAALYGTRIEPASLSTAPVHESTPAVHGISSPLNNPLSNPPPILSLDSSFSPVLKDKELRQETVSVTHEAQPALFSADLPEWATRLLELPAFAKRGITVADVTRTETDFHGINLAIEAGTFIERFQLETVKRPMATWRNWLKKEKVNGSNNGTNGRYPRRGLGPAVIPDDPSYYDRGSTLSAFGR